MGQHPSYCRLCLNGCSILVDVEEGRAVKVSGNKNNPVYQGFICVKGREQARILSDPKRLRHSLKRGRDGRLHPIPVDQAIAEIAGRLDEIRHRHGPRAVAGYLGTQFAVSAASLPLFTAFMQAIGSPMIFSPATIDKPGKKIGHTIHGRWSAPAVGFDDPEIIMLVGANPLVTFTGFPYGNPGKWLNERLEAGAKLIVIDPRRSDVARRAHLHLRPMPGQDAPIAASILNVLIGEKLYDAEFAANHTEGLSALGEAVSRFTPRAVAAQADIPAEQIVEAARLLGSTRRGYIMAGTGPNMSGLGTLIEYLLMNIHTLCGYWLRAGDRVRHPGALAQTLRPVAQVQPPAPAYGFGEKLRVRGLTSTASGLPTAALPDEILMPGEGKVRALISCGGNPVAAWPDQDRTIEAMRALDLLVQIDPWMSETSKLADYVIAPRIWLEVAGITQILDWLTRNGVGYGQRDPYAQYAPPIAEPPAGSDLVEEWQFFYRLGQRMDLPLAISSQMGPDLTATPLDMENEPSTDAVFDILCRGSRIPLEEVKKHPGGAIFPDPPLHVAPADPDCPHRFRLADPVMMGDLAALRPAPAQDEYPMRLLCRRMMHAYNTSFIDSLPASARPYNPAFLNPEDMVLYDIGEGETVEIVSAHGAIVAIAHADDTLRPGTVSISFGFGTTPEQRGNAQAGSNTTRLLSMTDIYDRYSGQPLMTNVPVAVRPLAHARRERYLVGTLMNQPSAS